MDHAQKRALQGTNEITGLGLRLLRLPSYTPACFWPDAPRPSSCTPLKTIGAKIVHPPEDGPWAAGYYSVLFEDPDGIRLEVNHVPGKGLLA